MTTKPIELDTIPLDAIDDVEVDGDADSVPSVDRLMSDTDQGWDVEAQVLTLQKAAADLPPPPQSKEPPPQPHRKGPPPLPGGGSWTPEPSAVRHMQADMSHPGALIDLLHNRLAGLEVARDKVGLARVQIELAIASETILGDEDRAAVHAEAALKVDPASAAAHAMLRRMKHARSALPAMLAHLEHELAAATTEPHKVELLAEKARLLEALGNRGPDARGHLGAGARATPRTTPGRSRASRRSSWRARSVRARRAASGRRSRRTSCAWPTRTRPSRRSRRGCTSSARTSSSGDSSASTRRATRSSARCSSTPASARCATRSCGTLPRTATGARSCGCSTRRP